MTLARFCQKFLHHTEETSNDQRGEGNVANPSCTCRVAQVTTAAANAFASASLTAIPNETAETDRRAGTAD